MRTYSFRGFNLIEKKPNIPFIFHRGDVIKLILDGSSEHGAHVWKKAGRYGENIYLVKSKESSNLIFVGKYLFYFIRAQYV